MKTEVFNKIFEATDSIRQLELIESRLKQANESLKVDITTFNTIANELNSTAEVITPLLRDYLSNVIDVRMAFGREVIHIIESARQLNVITKAPPEINAACDSLAKL